MSSSKRQTLIDSHFKKGGLFIEIENELNLDDYTNEEISFAVKEGVRKVLKEIETLGR